MSLTPGDVRCEEAWPMYFNDDATSVLSHLVLEVSDSSWDAQSTIGRDAFTIQTSQKASVAWKCAIPSHGTEWHPAKYSQLRQHCDPGTCFSLNAEHVRILAGTDPTQHEVAFAALTGDYSLADRLTSPTLSKTSRGSPGRLVDGDAGQRPGIVRYIAALRRQL